MYSVCYPWGAHCSHQIEVVRGWRNTPLLSTLWILQLLWLSPMDSGLCVIMETKCALQSLGLCHSFTPVKKTAKLCWGQWLITTATASECQVMLWWYFLLEQIKTKRGNVSFSSQCPLWSSEQTPIWWTEVIPPLTSGSTPTRSRALSQDTDLYCHALLLTVQSLLS